MRWFRQGGSERRWTVCPTDTKPHDPASQASGLLSIAVGLSRMYRDVTQQLEAGLGVLDAPYRWARGAMDEEHGWPKGASA
ncbi:hypothetical protein O2N63_15315 [Aliiroseovarius sp. KMU-50]|uniref:Uncharacterized protein n=1 Tax=Aliiroseovarius salicola TaxID=3009082 RepID=A0ABT4W4L5_9RHOB|nr:hypothetical protein [Aliiroseovarius sp. KMU-50]MDA5095457.1 hypothetical protein [Aliiroseovarius sp. KMU-50]